jgi:AcrR family transcriptional regulator
MPANAKKRTSRASPERNKLVEVASRERIHATALRLFARYGYDAVSLQMIADEVGLHKSTLFHHYASKLEIVDEVLNQIVERVLGWLERVRRVQPPTLEAFFEAMDELLDFFADQPDAARLLVSAMSVPPDSELASAGSAERVIEFYSGLAGWLSDARKLGVIRHVSIRQTIPNLMGIVLFYPAVAGDLHQLVGPDPFSPRARAVRKAEVRRMIAGLLAP